MKNIISHIYILSQLEKTSIVCEIYYEAENSEVNNQKFIKLQKQMQF